MSGLQNTTEQFKDNGAGPVPTPDTPATIAQLPTAHPKRRESIFALQIWNVERKPAFTRSRIYGFAG